MKLIAAVAAPPDPHADALQADLNYDDQVDQDDLDIFLEVYTVGKELADFDLDGDIDIDDLLSYLNAYAAEME